MAYQLNALVERDITSLRNLFGPLSDDLKDRLREVIRNPNDQKWENAHSIIIAVGPGCGMGLTLWQSILKVDVTFPSYGPRHHGKHRDKWETIPTRQRLVQAIHRAALIAQEHDEPKPADDD